jgi:hypothetical protein
MPVMVRAFGMGTATLVSLVLSASCGSRSALIEEQGPPIIECTKDTDCDGAGDLCNPIVCRANQCQAQKAVDCDDGNPCTTDICNSANGVCSHEPATLDLDGDGRRAPLPGKKAGEPGACGDDCDDTNREAHPGGVEICDGVDNDCNGVVDDGATFVSSDEPVRVSATESQAVPAGLGYAGGSDYMSSYTGLVEKRESFYLARLHASGTRLGNPQRFTQIGPDSYGGPLVWTGDRFGTAWTDRRDAQGEVINWEVYFNELGPDGAKLGPDLRISHADGFSVIPSLVWTGNQFVIVWQDDGLSFSGLHEMYGQRVDLAGHPVGEMVKLVDDPLDGQESPAIAVGSHTLGITWMRGNSTDHHVMFATFDFELRLQNGPLELTGGMAAGVFPGIVWNQTAYVVSWYSPDPPHAIYGAVVAEDARPVVPAKQITKSPLHSRYPTILPYGDRVLLVWSDDKDGNDGYEIYAKSLDARLEPLTEERRLTHAPGQSIEPIASFGPQGEVGILFRDDREGTPQVYFTRLSCLGGSLER